MITFKQLRTFCIGCGIAKACALLCGAMLSISGCASTSPFTQTNSCPILLRWDIVGTNEVRLTLFNSDHEDWLIQISDPVYLDVVPQDPSDTICRLTAVPDIRGRTFVLLHSAVASNSYPCDATHDITGRVSGFLAGKRVCGLDFLFYGLPVSRLPRTVDSEEWKRSFFESLRTALSGRAGDPPPNRK